jgi:hypothetical protein
MFVFAGFWALDAPLLAQGSKTKRSGNEQEKVAGKIAKIERKGKAVTLSIEKNDGQTLEVLLTPKLQLTISAEGDAGFFQQPRAQVTSSRVVQANDRLFSNEFTVHFGKGLIAGYQRDQNAADLYHVCGSCTAADNESITLNLGNAGARRIFFEQGAALKINVSSNDPELLAEGAAVEIEGTSKGPKFVPAKVSVTLAAPLIAAEVFAKADPRKAKPAPNPSAKGTKKGAKPKKGDTDVDEDDPFGVLEKKEGKAEKNSGEKKSED